MPIPLIALILAGAAALAVVVLAIVYYDDIIAWFRARNDIKVRDKNNVAFTIKQKMDNGEYKLVQGIFNKRTEQVVDGQVVQTKMVDERLADVHGQNELVLYE
jgi:hypothetical protein